MSEQTPVPDFFGALFDFSFSTFITSRVIRVIYGLGIALAGLLALGTVIFAFQAGPSAGLLGLLVAALMFMISTMYLRVMLEVLIVVFRIAEDVQYMAHPGPSTEEAPPGF